ncbi:PREDICTED: probable adenylate kinase 6, chloroplastic [Nicotiana attenuata]|uniref:adenylate kinase n=1 Tax=Nicotiana attenuata TaxID=49451 RepID=A0A1J6KDJ4_NICAT|nr:PREDICTED: probable adenylate kinase 6, chloroplastic [Nicotiana attenuata]OIT28138.1 putative adenylate kinase 6, chloroplastic [Nicotiana attenuata]
MTVWSRAVVRWRCSRVTNLTYRGFCYNKPSKTDLQVPPLPANLPAGSPASSFKDKGRNVQWVFLGCPGVGKGTYAARLSKLLGVPHIATGDLVRHELSSHGPLASQLVDIVNQGKLISDEIIIDLLSKRLEAGEAKGEAGFILDGFPRTIHQAEILEGVTDIDLVINLKLREDALIAKCLGRRICSECGGNYNVACIDIKADDDKTRMYMPPLLPPPHCENKLITRSDDTEDVVKERLRIYHETSRPVEDFYRRRGKLLEFDLPGGIPESWPKLLQALNIYDDEDKKSAAA